MKYISIIIINEVWIIVYCASCRLISFRLEFNCSAPDIVRQTQSVRRVIKCNWMHFSRVPPSDRELYTIIPCSNPESIKKTWYPYFFRHLQPVIRAYTKTRQLILIFLRVYCVGFNFYLLLLGMENVLMDRVRNGIIRQGTKVGNKHSNHQQAC